MPSLKEIMIILAELINSPLSIISMSSPIGKLEIPWNALMLIVKHGKKCSGKKKSCKEDPSSVSLLASIIFLMREV